MLRDTDKDTNVTDAGVLYLDYYYDTIMLKEYTDKVTDVTDTGVLYLDYYGTKIIIADTDKETDEKDTGVLPRLLLHCKC